VEYSSHYTSEEEYHDWFSKQQELTRKYEAKMVELMGAEGDSVAEALVGYLPEDITNELLSDVGLAVFVYDHEEVLNHGKVIYKDQNLTITEQLFTPEKEPIDNLLEDFLNDLFESKVDTVSQLSDHSGEVVMEVLPAQKEKAPEIAGTIHNVWVRVDIEEAKKD